MSDNINTGKTANSNDGIHQPAQKQYEEVMFYERKPAGFWIRFWAYLIDLLVISGVTSILLKPAFALIGVSVDSTNWYAAFTILSALLFYTYFVLMTKFFSQTVGKMIFAIKVVSLKKDSLDWGTLLFREWIGRLISVTILPLYFIVGFTPLKQGVHDFFADTTVVHEQSYRKRKMMQKVRDNGSGLQEESAF
ncbi:RDD family protein [Planomicrobium sp. MB-3u-38]|uniref:RDD family protein n=1 Tax=Planomicrobium sp. MB-3u-38 TaxID=2058318 RepID=UPI000C7BEA4B|nr:RDD family protein [Planomicrobium sp. MB-3u-38]PKH11394.1 RDD family protein [Planomicrobium sp. MB-3u-38]